MTAAFALGRMGMNKNVINLVVAVAVIGVIYYLTEENTTLLFLAVGGIAYLLFANNLLKFGAA